MKKLFTVLLISGLFISCKKESTTTTTPNPSAAGSFKCTIDGVAFTADSAWYNNFNAGQTNIFASKGSGASLQYFEINLTGATATTYAIPASAFTYLTATNTYPATGGSLSISTYDMTNRKISGSFTGVTAGTLITNGVFTNLPYK